jgi:hypothetical protein
MLRLGGDPEADTYPTVVLIMSEEAHVIRIGTR